MPCFDNVVKNHQLAVILTVFKRLDRLPDTLNQLSNQTNPDFDLFILNNNTECKPLVDKIVSDSNQPCRVFHQESNLGPWIRFMLADKLYQAGYPYVVFLDDDLTIGPTAIDTLTKEAGSNKLVSAVVCNFKRSFHDMKRVQAGMTGTYAAPGCSIMPTSIFANQDFWLNWKEEDHCIDDSYLNWFCRYMVKVASFADIKLLKATDRKVSMWHNPVIRAKQEKFYQSHKY